MLIILLTLIVLYAAIFVGIGRAYGGVPARVDAALHNASRRYGVAYDELRSVSWCESRWNPRAIGNGSHGLFQFLRGTWARTPYGTHDIYDPWWNALAAAWLVRRDGGWREWTCQP